MCIARQRKLHASKCEKNEPAEITYERFGDVSDEDAAAVVVFE